MEIRPGEKWRRARRSQREECAKFSGVPAPGCLPAAERLAAAGFRGCVCALGRGHGGDQEGGEDDAQGQGTDVRCDPGAEGNGQRSAQAHGGGLTQPERVCLAMRERPDDPQMGIRASSAVP